tara:strand:+ start:2112 stop:2936 length:825 start_codon:yes stop_codon:yes gene_type:complete
LKLTTYIIVSVLLFSFSSAANKSITELGEVQIEDLFYNSDSPLIPAEIEKIELYQVDKILEKNEDLELESLEIADIDLATFGEYETFLNKYYDDNYVSINSKFIKQLELNVSTSGGVRIPAGANAKLAFNSGIDFGLTLSPNSTFKIFNKDSRLYGNLNITQITPINSRFIKYKITRFTGGITSYINKHIFLSSGLSLIYQKNNTIENYESSLGYSINIDLGFKFNVIRNINMGLYTRAQIMPSGVLDPPIDGGGTLETLSIGLIFESPVYLVY